MITHTSDLKLSMLPSKGGILASAVSHYGVSTLSMLLVLPVNNVDSWDVNTARSPQPVWPPEPGSLSLRKPGESLPDIFTAVAWHKTVVVQEGYRNCFIEFDYLTGAGGYIEE
jgi:hypothetical protein